jgi:aminopeptidase N
MMLRYATHGIILVGMVTATALSQSFKDLPGMEAAAYERNASNKQESFYQSAASPWLDVTYYVLKLDIATGTSYLSGKVTIKGVCKTNSAGSLVLDLVNTMHVDSTIMGGLSTAFAQSSSSVSISLDRAYNAGDALSVDVYYEGVPAPTGFGSFEFGSHANTPWVYSLSEPSGARDWWPCKDDPADKADSSDVIVTCDSSFKVGSNGLLVSVVNNGDGTTTFHWQERYPIASYLISVALTNYAQFSNWFKYSSTDSMQILNYVLPEHLADAMTRLLKTVDMLSVYSNLFGLYPFIKEKYGHAEFGSGGAMEHQTMTSTTTFAEDVISHELAHQWFGDMITCRTWGDLWLNEGFAQYCSGLFREQEYGKASYDSYMGSQMSVAVEAIGAIGVPDSSSVRNLFDPARIYSKGACVLHMLRHVLGDSVFFRSLRAYANDPAFQYATATIPDFQRVCETVSGMNLSYFFQEWIWGEGYPHYDYAWSSKPSGNGYALTINLTQSTNVGNPMFFTMPIDFRVSTVTGDTTITVFNDSLSQQFACNVAAAPVTVLLDPGNWILKLAFSDNSRPANSYSLSQNYPNPFNPKTTLTFQLPTRSFVTLRVYDILGREISTLLNEQRGAGLYSIDWDSSSLPSGVYLYRLLAHPVTGMQFGNFDQTRKMVVVK